MEDDVLDILESLGYKGELLDKSRLLSAVEKGPKSVEYTQLVEWLSKELKALCKLDDHVNAITKPEDSNLFLLEVSSFLKETNCPHHSLTRDNVNQRLQTVDDRILLLVFLGTEVQAGRIISFNESSTSKAMEVDVIESPTARDLKKMLIALGISKPPANVTAAQLFSKIETKVKERLSSTNDGCITKALFNGLLSAQQWQALAQLHKEMLNDYSLRRQMLLTRLDVTIQSFQWSGKAKLSKDAVAAAFEPQRVQINVEPDVNLAKLLSAREDLSILEKTSSSSVRKNTTCAINKVLIGRVPDRGGRPSEQQPPPPEMPSWQKRSDSAPSGRGGGGRGGGGGRVQGGWSSGHQQEGRGGRGGRGGHDYNQGGWSSGQRGGYQQDRDRGGGGYQQDRGGYQQEGGGRQQQYAADYSQGGYGYGYEQQQQPQGNYHQGGGGGGRGGRGGHRGGGQQSYYAHNQYY